MPTTINADVTFGGYIVTADASGTLALQASGNTALTVNPQRAIGVGQTPSFGTAGQVLTSQGSAAAPTWVSASSFPIGTVISSNTAPSSGTWLETGKYYSKSTYPALAAAVGNVPDLGIPRVASGLNNNAALSSAGIGFIDTSAIDCYATNGTVTIFASGGSGIVVTSNGTDWKIVPSLDNSSIYDVKYLNGKFFIVGDSTIGVSSDGYNWDIITVPATGCRAISYGASKYVLTVSSSSVLTSTDLVTWTRILIDSVTPSNSYHKLVFANNTFVAITLTGKYVYSADGTTWTVPPTFNQPFRDIAFGNGVWVGINIQGSSVVAYTSSNLSTWTTISSVSGWLSGHAASKIKFLNGLFFIVAAEYIARSTDGITWTFPRLNISDYGTPSMNDIVWNGTHYIVAGESACYSTSTDGTTWTGKRAATSNSIKQLAVTPNNFVTAYYCLFNNSTAVFDKTIIGSASWTLSYAGSYPQLYHNAVAYNGTNTYICATNNNIYSSSDGETWTAVNSLNIPISGTTNWCRAKYVNGVFFVFGISDAAGMVYSTDNGVTWLRPAGLAATGKWVSDIAFGNNFWVITTVSSGSGSCYYASTLNGIWTSFLTTSGTRFGDVVYFNNQFVIGAQLGIHYGMPGTAFTQVTLTGGTNLVYMRLFTANNILLALPTNDTSGNVASANWIYTSTNGTAWTQRTVPSFAARNNVAWNGTAFCMSGDSSLETSTDGTTWTNRYPTSPSRSFNLGGVATIGNNFVATGAINSQTAIFTSTDNGVTWKIQPNNATTTTNYVGQAGTKAFIHHSIYGLFSSTDCINWKINNNYSTQTGQPSSYEARAVKLGGKYFISGFSAHQSSDGVSWFPITTLPYTGQGDKAIRFAYNGTFWLAVVESAAANSPLAIYKSTDGVTWAYLSNPFNLLLHVTANLLSCVPSLVYANGEFLLGLSTRNTSLNQYHYLYASTDGITWNPRSTPSSLPVGDMDTDGTTVVISNTANINGLNFNGIFKTTDNGLNWQTISLANMHNITSSSYAVRVLYLSSNSTWIIGGYKSTDLTNFTAITASNHRLTSTYWVAVGEYIVSFEGNGSLGNYLYATLHNKNTSYSHPLVIEGKGTILTINNIGQSEVFTNANGDVLLPAYITSTKFQPGNFVELPLYSYNTTTTFWVPPSYGSGKKDYIYAGA